MWLLLVSVVATSTTIEWLPSEEEEQELQESKHFYKLLQEKFRRARRLIMINMKCHTKFGAFVRSITIMQKNDAKHYVKC